MYDRKPKNSVKQLSFNWKKKLKKKKRMWRRPRFITHRGGRGPRERALGQEFRVGGSVDSTARYISVVPQILTILRVLILLCLLTAAKGASHGFILRIILGSPPNNHVNTEIPLFSVCLSPNSSVEALTPSVMVCRGGALGGDEDMRLGQSRWDCCP